MGLGNGQVDLLTWEGHVRGVRDVASLTPEAQQPLGSSSHGRPELMPYRAMSASHLSFVRRHCSITRLFLFKHTQMNVHFLPILYKKRQPSLQRLQTEQRSVQENSFWCNEYELLNKSDSGFSSLQFVCPPSIIVNSRKVSPLPSKREAACFGYGENLYPFGCVLEVVKGGIDWIFLPWSASHLGFFSS